MIRDIVKRILAGIALGGLSTFIALTIMKFAHFEATVSEIWSNMLASMIIGLTFGLSSYIFVKDKWSIVKKTIIHLSCSMIAYYLIALRVGCVPVSPLYLVLSAVVFALIYAVYWTSFYLYYRKVAKSLNKELQKDS